MNGPVRLLPADDEHLIQDAPTAADGTLRAGRTGTDPFPLAAEVPLTQETTEASGVTP